MRRVPKVISRAGWLLVLLAALLALPVIWVETSCQAPGPARQMQTLDLKEERYKRAEGDSFLTFPEWYIVHAYADLAGDTSDWEISINGEPMFFELSEVDLRLRWSWRTSGRSTCGRPSWGRSRRWR